jgi:mono/diheme cytochrome c family protein
MIGNRALAILAVLTFAAPAVAWSQTKPTLKRDGAKMTSSASGTEMFLSYCSPCHGKLGRGDGPAAPALKTKPADLTMLRKNHGGTFSDKDFEDKINGMTMTPAHGTTEMPVWGPIFRQLGNDQLRVYNLKKYIDSIQVQ